LHKEDWAGRVQSDGKSNEQGDWDQKRSGKEAQK
jgi:hypothetical protein